MPLVSRNIQYVHITVCNQARLVYEAESNSQEQGSYTATGGDPSKDTAVHVNEIIVGSVAE
jgi:hypothetical protein